MSFVRFGSGRGGRLRSVVAVLLCVALAGCVTVVNSLSTDDVATLKLVAVTVSIAPNASVQWEDGVRAYASAKSLPDDGLALAADTPEARAFIRNALAAKMKATLERRLTGEFPGHRQARLEIVVHNFVVANAVQKILIGGGHSMKADATLVDARTGAVIVSHPEMIGIALAGNGVVGTLVEAAVAGDPTERVIVSFSDRYRDWLLKKG